jgi:glycosyltransferase involved in cell wall biosynthesis
MKIIFSSFQGFNQQNQPLGVVKIVDSLLVYFKNEYVYYVSYKPLLAGNKKISILSFWYLSFLWLISVHRFVCERFGVMINQSKIRFYKEVLFDYFLSLKINKKSTLISTAYIPLSFKKNKQLGGFNLFIAGNAYDKVISNLVKSKSSSYGVEIDDAYSYQPRLKFIDKHIFYCDHVIANSSIVFNSYIKNFKKLPVDFIACHLSVKNYLPDAWFLKNKKLTFCYIAHTVWLKGLVYLIEAFNNFKSNDVQLLIAGSIDKNVLAVIEKTNASENIKIMGRVENLNAFLRTSHVCVVPSLLDNHPATIYEAMYCGLPVIVTDGCGSKDLVSEGKNGFVVPIANSDAIAEKIKWFIDNKEKISEMSVCARDSIKDINEARQNQTFANHIMNIVITAEQEDSFRQNLF